MNSGKSQHFYSILKHRTCLLLSADFYDLYVVGSNHSISTQASSHPSSCERSKVWYTGSLGGSPLQPSYFIDHLRLKTPEPLFLLSSVQAPLWAQPGCWTLQKGRQQVRPAGNVAAPGATTPHSFFQAHDTASCVWGGVRGSSDNAPSSAAAGLGLSSVGTEGVQGCPC